MATTAAAAAAAAVAGPIEEACDLRPRGWLTAHWVGERSSGRVGGRAGRRPTGSDAGAGWESVLSEGLGSDARVLATGKKLVQ